MGRKSPKLRIQLDKAKFQNCPHGLVFGKNLRLLKLKVTLLNNWDGIQQEVAVEVRFVMTPGSRHPNVLRSFTSLETEGDKVGGAFSHGFLQKHP